MYFWGKIHFVLGLLARDIANHSYAQKTRLTKALSQTVTKKISQSNARKKELLQGLIIEKENNEIRV